MKLFSWLKRSATSALDDFWFTPIYGNMSTAAGTNVDEFTALQTSPVYACINVISQDIGSVPLILYKTVDDGKEQAIEKSLYRILRWQANPEMSAMSFRQTMMGHVLGWGNAYAQIVRSRDNEVQALWPLLPNRIEIYRDSEQPHELLYKYTPRNSGEPTWLKQNDVLHIRGLGFDGVKGYSIIAMIARESIGLSQATEKYGASFFANGARPDLIFTHPGEIGAEGASNFIASWNSKHQGATGMHGTAVLEEGMTASTINIPNSDSQFIEARGFQVPEIARFYRVPLHKIQDLTKASFDNIAVQNIEYVNDCLRPWFVSIEQQIWMQLLNSREQKKYFAEFWAESLMRGDPEMRGNFYQDLFNIGSITPNEIRARENMNRYDGGDVHYIQLNMASVESGVFERDSREYGNNDETESEENDENSEEMEENERNISVNEHFMLRNCKNKEILVQRVKDQYVTLFHDAFSHIVKKESAALTRNAEKLIDGTKTERFSNWSDRFYEKDLSDFAESRIAPLVRSILSMCGDKNIDYNALTRSIVKRHVDKSKKIVSDIINEKPADMVNILTLRTNTWHDSRPMISSNEEIENLCGVII